jgi:hypothetical protein
MSARSSSARLRRDGAASADEGAGGRVPLPERRRARTPRVDDGRDAAAVPRDAGRVAAVAGGRLAPAVEFLFERLAVSWAVAGVEPITRQKELLARFRMASQAERRWIRDALREHLAEHFPELPPP